MQKMATETANASSPSMGATPAVPDSALRVLYRTAGCAVLGGLSGTVIASWRYAPGLPAAFQSAMSTGSSAFVFFSIREYMTVPAFHYISSQSPTPRRLKNVPETAAAGFGTGAFFSTYHFGPTRRILSGGVTFGLLATIGQLGFNELNLLRLRYIARRQATLDSPVANKAPPKPPLYQRVSEALFSVTPIRKVSDEEYSDTLRIKIRNAKEELGIVNGQLEDMEKRLVAVKQEQDGQREARL